jgi:nitric oxide reductase subunit B
VIGEFIKIHGGWRHVSQWFGGQGFECLDLGGFWRTLLTVGLFFWVVIVFRGLRARLRNEHLGNMPWLFFFSALSIPIFCGVGLLGSPRSHFTSTDFWRFWVVHLWVEDFLELLPSCWFLNLCFGDYRSWKSILLSILCRTVPTPSFFSETKVALWRR